jgi:hypothetical protein
MNREVNNMIKRVLITLALTSTMLFSVSNIAKAEVNYNYKNPEHTTDMVCIASLSIGRDIFSPAGVKPDQEIFLALTDLQNNIYLKYNSSSQLGNHIDARKILIKNSWTTDQLSDHIIGCRGRV